MRRKVIVRGVVRWVGESSYAAPMAKPSTKKRKLAFNPTKDKIIKTFMAVRSEYFTTKDIMERSGESRTSIHSHLIRHLSHIRIGYSSSAKYCTEDAREVMRSIGEIK